ncbi:MAG: Spy/CpxP family protein refolding chaperone [Balneolaceae bacterium]|nr:Spy/CpxP family protein refolding chaperone [Balneolaceae bacterium]
MKAIKKAILLTVCLMMGALSQVLAQPMNRAGLNAPGIQYIITQHGDDLQLSDDQKNELIALQIEHRNEFRSQNRPMMQNRKSDFRRGRNNGRRGPGDRGFSNANPQFMQARFDARMQMRQDVLDILSDEQVEQLTTIMTEQAERAHEFRTFRHEYIIEEAGIEGEKADQVLSLLNAQSAGRLDMAKQRIQNPTEVNQDLWSSHFERMRETNDQLQNILTVNEYQELRQNMGFGKRGDGNGNRASRRWNR